VIFTETRLAGAFLVDLERREDSRGFNARAWCAEEFAERGLVSSFVQSNVIVNHRRGTLRGFHYQAPPFGEDKLFRCVRGAIHDVIIDLRPASPTYREWVSVELSEESFRLLYVPKGFAQGFLTLVDSTEVSYQVSQPYSPAHGRGVRFDDPAFAIPWPIPVSVISEKDRSWPDFEASLVGQLS
jgi:dTDP-4-dehydrorhamnose 3,5-epimerase